MTLLTFGSLLSASPSSVNVTCHCRYIQDSAAPFPLSLPATANSIDLLNMVLRHVGLASEALQFANLQVGYKLYTRNAKHPVPDFIAPLTEIPIEDLFLLIPEYGCGEKLLDVSIFSEDDTIFHQTIQDMRWSPPQSFLDARPGPPDTFECLLNHTDTHHRLVVTLSASLTGLELKDTIRKCFFYAYPVTATENDPSLPAPVSDECLDVKVEIAGTPGHSRGLFCKLLDAWPLQLAVLAVTDDNHFDDRITINFSIRTPNHPATMFDSLPRGFDRWPLVAPVIVKFIADVGYDVSVTGTLKDALQDKNEICIMVWNAITKEGIHSDTRAIVLKEVADLLFFHRDEIEGMVLLEGIRRAAQ